MNYTVRLTSRAAADIKTRLHTLNSLREKGISPSDIHAALAYYYDNKAEIDTLRKKLGAFNAAMEKPRRSHHNLQ